MLQVRALVRSIWQLTINHLLLSPLVVLQKAITWTKLKVIQVSMSEEDAATPVHHCCTKKL